MKVNQTTLIVTLSTLAFAASVGRAETIQLNDGTVMEGELSAPTEVVVRTAEGERRVPFALLSPEAQKAAWAKWSVASTKSETAAATAQPVAAPLTEEELAALANEVSLETWAQVASIGSFRDKAEKRGAGGLVVTKAFNALDENWPSVYSEKHVVGTLHQSGRGRLPARFQRVRLLRAGTQAQQPHGDRRPFAKLFYNKVGTLGLSTETLPHP
jgi:hypothetical protein